MHNWRWKATCNFFKRLGWFVVPFCFPLGSIRFKFNVQKYKPMVWETKGSSADSAQVVFTSYHILSEFTAGYHIIVLVRLLSTCLEENGWYLKTITIWSAHYLLQYCYIANVPPSSRPHTAAAIECIWLSYLKRPNKDENERRRIE